MRGEARLQAYVCVYKCCFPEWQPVAPVPLIEESTFPLLICVSLDDIVE